MLVCLLLPKATYIVIIIHCKNTVNMLTRNAYFVLKERCLIKLLE